MTDTNVTNKRAEEYADGNEEFGKWLAELDKLVSDRVGLSLFDLEDMRLWDEWDSGSSPEDALRELVIPTVSENYGEECAALLA